MLSLCEFPLIWHHEEGYVVLESQPFVVCLAHYLVIEPKVLDNDVLDSISVSTLKPDIEQATLLGKEPLAQLFISAVCKTANKMRDVVVLALFNLLRWSAFSQFFASTSEFVLVMTFVGQSMVMQVLVNSILNFTFLISVIPGVESNKISHYRQKASVKVTYINSIFRRACRRFRATFWNS